MPNPNLLSESIRFPGGSAAPVVCHSGIRVNASATVASTAEAALPAGATVVEIRALDAIAIRFGNTGVGAAALDVNSMLFPAGEKVISVPKNPDGTPVTHFRCIRIGSADVPVQIEKINTQA